MKGEFVAKALASVFDLSPERRSAPKLCESYLKPSTGSDTEAMRSDFRAVGDDLRLALDQYGKKS
jgi:hypothetical protein